MELNSKSTIDLASLNEILSTKIHSLEQAEKYQSYVTLYKTFINLALKLTTETDPKKSAEQSSLNKIYKNITSLSNTNFEEIKVNREIKKCLEEYLLSNKTNEDCFSKFALDYTSPSNTYKLMKTAAEKFLGQLKLLCYNEVFEKFKDMNDKYASITMGTESNTKYYLEAKKDTLDLIDRCENLYPFYTDEDNNINHSLDALANQYLTTEEPNHSFCVWGLCI